MDMREKLQLVNLYLSIQPEPPINVVGLANRLGIKVYDAAWPDQISGKIQKDKDKGGDSGFAIFVNQNHPKTRKRFTIAHEIAHYVLHEDMIGDGIYDDALYRSGLSNQIEKEANGLAAGILMPWEQINKNLGKSTEELADLFNVSRDSMMHRLGVYV